MIGYVNTSVAETLSEDILFTNEEKLYLQKHPSIRVHLENAWYPFNFIEKGQASGYSNDLIRLIAQKVGLDIEFVAGYQWKEFLDKLKNQDIDVITNIRITPSREKYAIYTHYQSLTALDGLLVNENKIISADFSNINSLAVVEGGAYQETIQNKYPRIRLVTTIDTANAIETLRLGHVDGVLDSYDAINFYLQRSSIKSVKNISLYDHQVLSNSPLFMAVPKSQPILRDILDKGLLAISPTELNELHDKWPLLNASAALKQKDSVNEKRVVFSNRQAQYLKDHQQFRMCVAPDWLPVGAIYKGNYIGIAASIIQQFKKNINNDIVLVETNTWQETLNTFAEGKCDFIPVISNTPDRRKTMSFTFPYLRFPLVLTTHRNNEPYKLQQVLHKPLGIIKGYSYKETFEDLYGTVSIKEYDSIEASFDAIKKGEIYGFIDTLPVVTKKIQSTYPEFKIVDKLENEYALSLAVAKDNTTLLEIFNKLLASIKREELESILNRWTPVLYEKNKDVSVYIVSNAMLLLLVTLLLFGFLFLKIKNKKLQQKNSKFKSLSMHDSLTELPNRTYFEDQLTKEWIRAQRSKEVLSLMVLDVDDFKSFNKTYGRAKGDECLVELSRRLNNIIKSPEDLLACWGGEEFIILLPNTDDAGIKAISAEIFYILNSWSLQFSNTAEGKLLSVCIGAASMSVSSDYSESELTRRVFQALYRAQDTGHNQMVIYKSGH